MQYGVESIGENAFEGCSSLKEVILPDSVIEIGTFAFRYCTNLEKVQLSNNITTIENQTFAVCTNLTTINMPDNLTSIVEAAFSNCNKLDNIHIPGSVTSIGSSAFSGCTSLYNLTIDEANTVYEVEDGIIYTKDNSTLIMLAPMAEEVVVTIRDGVKRLEEGSLLMCTSMTTLNLPSSLEYITGQAFPSNTATIETINISTSNPYYYAEDGYIYSKDGKELVYVASAKTIISINENVETIKEGAMYNVMKATEIVIPDNVTTIEREVFTYGSNELIKLDIGKGVSNLSSRFKGWGGIYNAKNLEITIDSENPNYKVENNLILTKDGKKVITFCKPNVQTQVVPEGVEELENYAFAGFANAEEIELPSTLKVIGISCFADCDNIKAIEIPNSIETIEGYAFNLCDVLETVTIDKEQGSISGSPWGAPKGERSIIWLR